MQQQLGGMTKYLFPFAKSTVAAVGGFLLIVFLSIYFATDPELYRRGVLALIPVRRRELASQVMDRIAHVLRKWLVTQLIAMAVIGSVSTIALLLLGVKAAFALGLLAGLFEFIPTVGPILSAVPAIAMGFLDSPEKALLVALVYMGIQFLENHILIPLLMKGGMDLPPALTVLAQALLALVFGFLGLMVAVPLLATAMVIVQMLYVQREQGVSPQRGEQFDPDLDESLDGTAAAT
jgi:predicted PurR-regulated permease PerM